MNAVDILENVEKYFDRHHSFYVMWGGLFALIFFGIYIPFTIHHKVMEKVQAQQMANVYLVAQMDDMIDQWSNEQMMVYYKTEIIFTLTAGQTQYKQEYLATLYTADMIYGVKAMRTAATVGAATSSSAFALAVPA